MKFDLVDVEVKYYNPNERANGWRLDPNIAVHLIHKPTGLKTRCANFYEKSRNYEWAFRKLMEKVNEHQVVEIADLNANLDTISDYVNAGKVIPAVVWNRAIANGITMRDDVIDEVLKVISAADLSDFGDDSICDVEEAIERLKVDPRKE